MTNLPLDLGKKHKSRPVVYIKAPELVSLENTDANHWCS